MESLSHAVQIGACVSQSQTLRQSSSAKDKPTYRGDFSAFMLTAQRTQCAALTQKRKAKTSSENLPFILYMAPARQKHQLIT